VRLLRCNLYIIAMLSERFGSGSDCRTVRGTVPARLGVFGPAYERGAEVENKDKQHTLSWLQEVCVPTTSFRHLCPPSEAFAPHWLRKAPIAAGRVVKLGAKPGEVLSAISSFLQEGAVPCEVETVDAWTLKGVLFVDFCAVVAQIKIFSEPLAQTTVAHFQHTSGGDVVRFAELVGLVVKNLELLGIRGDFNQSPSLVEDWFGDDDFSDSEPEPEPWFLRVQAVLETAGPVTAIATQEEAWRTLASWAAKEPASRPVLAAALFTSRAVLALLFSALDVASKTPLSVLYPMAAAIRFAAMAPDACLLADELLQALSATDKLPPLVRHELAIALPLLRDSRVETCRHSSGFVDGQCQRMTGSSLRPTVKSDGCGFRDEGYSFDSYSIAHRMLVGSESLCHHFSDDRYERHSFNSGDERPSTPSSCSNGSRSSADLANLTRSPRTCQVFPQGPLVRG